MLAACADYPFKSFGELREASQEARAGALRTAVKRAGLEPADAGILVAGLVLTEERVAMLLDRDLARDGFRQRFERVAPLLVRMAPGGSAGTGAQAAEGARWAVQLLGMDGAQVLADVVERSGADPAALGRAMHDARRAQEEEARKRFEATWGTFAAWSSRPQNADALDSVAVMFGGDADLKRLRSAHRAEKRANDRKARPDRTVYDPVYPQLSGAFGFVKILDRSAGEALFSASDGLFVLRLSEGDSFQAYPGQLVRMTIHNRGEEMPMTNGSRLPVFISGRGPTVPREIPGYEPDRTRESRLADRIDVVERVMARDRAALRDDGGGRFVLEKPSPVRIVFERGKRGWERALVMDGALDRAIYCIREGDGACPDSAQRVALKELLGVSDAR